MSSYELFDHYRMMEEQHIFLSFKGEISNKTLVSLAEMLKKMFSGGDRKLKITKKIFSIFVELAQNIHLYSAKKVIVDNKAVGSGIIVIEKNKGFYRVKSGNLIEKPSIRPLFDKISHINMLDKTGLKKFYNRQLRSPRESNKKGAGVGLVVIARKSGNPIDIRSNPIDEDQAFVELSTKIGEEEQ